MQASDLHTFLLLTQSYITKQTQVTDQIISNSTNIILECSIGYDVSENITILEQWETSKFDDMQVV